MRICFDLDNTICTEPKDLTKAQPHKDRVKHINKLHDEGNYIIIDTARGSMTGINWRDIVEKQLKRWGVKYDELRTGEKPFAHAYVDDKAINSLDYFTDARTNRGKD